MHLAAHYMLLFWLLLVPATLAAQATVYSGRCIDAESGEPIAYASLRIAGSTTGTLSNATGAFSLPVQHAGQHVAVSCLGYERQVVTAPDAPGDWVIRLVPRPYTLGEVFIYPDETTARDMLSAAFRALKTNMPTQGYVLHSFYRHYCRESGVYGRLIEAALDIHDQAGHDRLLRSPDQKLGVAVQQVRRSLDFTRFSAQRHVPIALYTTLIHDPTSYQGPLWLHLKDEAFRYEFTGNTYLDGEVVHIIRASGRDRGRHYSADVYLQARDLAFLRVAEQISHTTRRGSQRTSRFDHYRFAYQHLNGRYYLSHALNEGRLIEAQLDSMGHTAWSRDHYHHVELMVHEVGRADPRVRRGNEPGEAALRAVPYTPTFWAAYPILAATPLEEDIARDLSSRLPLNEQFRYSQLDHLPGPVADRLSEIQIERLLAQYRGQPVLLVFWDANYEPGVKDLLRIRQLVQHYGQATLGLVMVSLDADETAWRAAIERRQLAALDHFRLAQGVAAPLTRRYGVTGSPYFVLLDGAGQPVLQGASLPRDKALIPDSLLRP
ncbi:MAG: hypothetical protein OHK0039_39630 [Bacteroidia bacterium]